MMAAHEIRHRLQQIQRHVYDDNIYQQLERLIHELPKPPAQGITPDQVESTADIQQIA